MEIQFSLIAFATLWQFVLGALWYSPLMFGKLWMKIMGATQMSKEEMAKMQKEIAPFYLLQILLTLIFTWELAHTINADTGANPYFLALVTWFGYIVPIQISGVIWGSTPKKYWLKQICVITANQFVGMMVATYILLF